MKTAIIYNEIPNDLRYFVLDGDLRRFHKVYINIITDGDDSIQQELNDLLYDEKGIQRFVCVDFEEFVEVIRDGAYVIECGFVL